MGTIFLKSLISWQETIKLLTYECNILGGKQMLQIHSRNVKGYLKYLE